MAHGHNTHYMDHIPPPLPPLPKIQITHNIINIKRIQLIQLNRLPYVQMSCSFPLRTHIEATEAIMHQFKMCEHLFIVRNILLQFTWTAMQKCFFYVIYLLPIVYEIVKST